ncbi:MAG: DUF2723 domain-containing protein [Chloroflexi bacterium]|nr:DUF2723 domain-containing protein [Chloroflexota bacterium]
MEGLLKRQRAIFASELPIRTLWLAGALAALLIVAYLPTLQTIPSGAEETPTTPENYFMRDVGETQIVLNVWGTLHATGYPLYVMTGNLLVDALRLLGVDAVVAPALVSLLWGLVALALLYILSAHLTGHLIAAAAVMVLYGLTRTVWIHQVIAEIYTFGLVILLVLLLLALWRAPIRHRVYWLAFVGGIGVAHHRAIILAAPALIYAVWPLLNKEPRHLRRTLLICLGIGLTGLVPYLYLPLRAWMGAAWVYGDPGTLAGFWDQFIGREATGFVGLPHSFLALAENFHRVNYVIISDLTLPGVLLGVAGLIVGVQRYRRAAITLALNGAVPYLFHVFLYTDILSALILPATLSLVLGWLLLADWLFSQARHTLADVRIRYAALMRSRHLLQLITQRGVPPLAALLLGIALETDNHLFIDNLTSDPRGLQTIALAQTVPDDAALMLAWGPRYFAVGFAQAVRGDLPDLRLVDHQADFAALLAEGRLVTPPYTFFNQSLDWWEARLHQPVYLRAIAPDLIQIDTQPERAAGVPLRTEIIPEVGVGISEMQVSCPRDRVIMRVAWYAPATPPRDLSVFVHLIDSRERRIAQDDRSAPVYGWRPLTTWLPGEVVRDVYTLPRPPGSHTIRYGWYTQLENGSFQNFPVGSLSIPEDCPR